MPAIQLAKESEEEKFEPMEEISKVESQAEDQKNEI